MIIKKQIFKIVKGKKEDKILRDLFRQKLENAEVIPSPSVSMKIMKQVGRKEFLHFNPSRFNIWYTGGIAFTGTVLAIVLATHPGKIAKPLPVSAPAERNIQSDTVNRNIVTVRTPVQNQGERAKTSPTHTKIVSGNTSVGKGSKTKVEAMPAHPENISAPYNTISTIGKKELFTGAAVEKNKIQPQSAISENQIEASVTEGCAPLKVTFKNRISSCDSCHWTFGDGGFSNQKNPKWLFDIPGEYKVNLKVFCSGKLLATSSVSIIVHTSPVARFEFTPEKAVLPRDEISFHNYSTDAVKFRWEFGDGATSDMFEPVYFYKKQGHYNVKLVALSEFGCSDSVIVRNAFSGSDYYIEFPNAFIANINGPSNGYYSQKSDEAAQVFHPAYSGVSEYQFKIFSRIGLLVFESNDINIGWDGYFKGQLCDPGVYIWKVRGEFLNGESFTKMGDVTLLKN